MLFKFISIFKLAFGHNHSNLDCGRNLHYRSCPKQWGADIMNCMAMIPVHDTPFENLKSPSSDEIHHIRRSIGGDINQMTHCNRCRADACGKLGER